MASQSELTQKRILASMNFGGTGQSKGTAEGIAANKAINPNSTFDLSTGMVSNPGVSSDATTAAPVVDAAAVATRVAAAKLASAKAAISGKRNAVADAYNALFGDLDVLGRDRAGDIERKAGENINDLTGQYTASIPKIQSSYAALGAGDSTDVRDANITAKNGYDKSVKQVGDSKNDDLAKVGQYVNENKANFTADRDSIFRLIDQAGQSDNEGDVRQADNDVANRIGQATATRATLGTDAGARGALSNLTADAGRFDSIKGSLDSIMQSSLAGGVKAAAVEAASNAAGLTDEDKQKIKLQYGNVYDTPVTA